MDLIIVWTYQQQLDQQQLLQQQPVHRISKKKLQLHLTNVLTNLPQTTEDLDQIVLGKLHFMSIFT